MKDSEIRMRKWLRPLFTYLKEKAEAHATLKASDEQEREEACARELGEFMREHGYTDADLMALRERPAHWDHFYAQKWEWFLRRLQNQHWQAIKAR